mmetsp:Transcript_16248/g.35131  ORF Transcript_16248/g.35131 Transcript_16248/m.35131 type:complete len:82 (-) Transcript_16248:2621-2866(-)
MLQQRVQHHNIQTEMQNNVTKLFLTGNNMNSVHDSLHYSIQIVNLSLVHIVYVNLFACIVLWLGEETMPFLHYNAVRKTER